MEKLQDFFQDNPHYFGIILVLLGILLLVGSYRNWEWIFQGDGRVFNIEWLSTTFGRTIARIAMGILAVIFILLGTGWFFLFHK